MELFLTNVKITENIQLFYREQNVVIKCLI